MEIEKRNEPGSGPSFIAALSAGPSYLFQTAYDCNCEWKARLVRTVSLVAFSTIVLSATRSKRIQTKSMLLA